MSDEENKIAVALGYEQGSEEAPKIVATGKDELAERMIEIARANGVEIRQDRELADILSVLEVDSLIPFEAYASVAEILSYVYRKNSEKAQGQAHASANS